MDRKRKPSKRRRMSEIGCQTDQPFMDGLQSGDKSIPEMPKEDRFQRQKELKREHKEAQKGSPKRGHLGEATDNNGQSTSGMQCSVSSTEQSGAKRILRSDVIGGLDGKNDTLRVQGTSKFPQNDPSVKAQNVVSVTPGTEEVEHDRTGVNTVQSSGKDSNRSDTGNLKGKNVCCVDKEQTGGKRKSRGASNIKVKRGRVIRSGSGVRKQAPNLIPETKDLNNEEVQNSGKDGNNSEVGNLKGKKVCYVEKAKTGRKRKNEGASNTMVKKVGVIRSGSGGRKQAPKLIPETKDLNNEEVQNSRKDGNNSEVSNLKGKKVCYVEKAQTGRKRKNEGAPNTMVKRVRVIRYESGGRKQSLKLIHEPNGMNKVGKEVVEHDSFAQNSGKDGNISEKGNLEGKKVCYVEKEQTGGKKKDGGTSNNIVKRVRVIRSGSGGRKQSPKLVTETKYLNKVRKTGNKEKIDCRTTNDVEKVSKADNTGKIGDTRVTNCTEKVGKADNAGKIGDTRVTNCTEKVGKADNAGKIGDTRVTNCTEKVGKADNAGKIGDTRVTNCTEKVGKADNAGKIGDTRVTNCTEKVGKADNAGKIGDTRVTNCTEKVGKADNAGKIGDTRVTNCTEKVGKADNAGKIGDTRVTNCTEKVGKADNAGKIGDTRVTNCTEKVGKADNAGKIGDTRVTNCTEKVGKADNAGKIGDTRVTNCTEKVGKADNAGKIGDTQVTNCTEKVGKADNTEKIGDTRATNGMGKVCKAGDIKKVVEGQTKKDMEKFSKAGDTEEVVGGPTTNDIETVSEVRDAEGFGEGHATSNVGMCSKADNTEKVGMGHTISDLENDSNADDVGKTSEDQTTECMEKRSKADYAKKISDGQSTELKDGAQTCSGKQARKVKKKASQNKGRIIGARVKKTKSENKIGVTGRSRGNGKCMECFTKRINAEYEKTLSKSEANVAGQEKFRSSTFCSDLQYGIQNPTARSPDTPVMNKQCLDPRGNTGSQQQNMTNSDLGSLEKESSEPGCTIGTKACERSEGVLESKEKERSDGKSDMCESGTPNLQGNVPLVEGTNVGPRTTETVIRDLNLLKLSTDCSKSPEFESNKHGSSDFGGSGLHNSGNSGLNHNGPETTTQNPGRAMVVSKSSAFEGMVSSSLDTRKLDTYYSGLALLQSDMLLSNDLNSCSEMASQGTTKDDKGQGTPIDCTPPQESAELCKKDTQEQVAENRVQTEETSHHLGKEVKKRVTKKRQVQRVMPSRRCKDADGNRKEVQSTGKEETNSQKEFCRTGREVDSNIEDGNSNLTESCRIKRDANNNGEEVYSSSAGPYACSREVNSNIKDGNSNLKEASGCGKEEKNNGDNGNSSPEASYCHTVEVNSNVTDLNSNPKGSSSNEREVNSNGEDGNSNPKDSNSCRKEANCKGENDGDSLKDSYSHVREASSSDNDSGSNRKESRITAEDSNHGNKDHENEANGIISEANRHGLNAGSKVGDAYSKSIEDTNEKETKSWAGEQKSSDVENDHLGMASNKPEMCKVNEEMIDMQIASSKSKEILGIGDEMNGDAETKESLSGSDNTEMETTDDSYGSDETAEMESVNEGNSKCCADGEANDKSVSCDLSPTTSNEHRQNLAHESGDTEEDQHFIDDGLATPDNSTNILSWEQSYRGNGGWERSLRQKPSKRTLFQIGKSQCIDSKDSSQVNDEKKREFSLRKNPMKTNLFHIRHRQKKDEPNGDRTPEQKAQSNNVEHRKWSISGDVRKKSGDVKQLTENPRSTYKSAPNNLPATNVSSPCSSKDPQVETTTEPQELNRRTGKIVWAKFGRKIWWPAVVVQGKMASMKPADLGSSWVFWFGDHKISQIQQDKMVPFVSNYQSMKGKNNGSKLFSAGIQESIKLCAERCGMNTTTMMKEDLLMWADSTFGASLQDKLSYTSFDPKPECPLPKLVLDKLKKIGTAVMERRGLQLDMEPEEDIIKMEKKREEVGSGIAAVRSGQKQIEEVCLGCDDVGRIPVCEHPLFQGGLCKDCKDEIIEGMFAVGADGTGMFCAICGTGGKMFVCDDKGCNRTYCLECMTTFLEEKDVVKIQMTNPWSCFLCTTYTKHTHGYLKPKANWKQNVIQLFDTGYRVEVPDLSYLSGDEKRPLRVLSLFDGIGTGKLILDQLRLDVEIYYASEIDPDSMLCTSVNHGDAVVHIGDVTTLTTEKIEKLGPIDLLIGGSPCNDLSLANPDRKGFSSEGTGCLFFDFVRVLMTLQMKAKLKGRHLFWMYENVASMKKEYSTIITRFLECEPALWDAKFFSAQTRARYFWGNIPGMYSTPYLSDCDRTVDLNDMLAPNCKRVAKVSSLRTVTTKRNSLKQGVREDIFPVLMDGKEDIIWINELERIFGFPAHYTDCGNLPVTRRQRLLGKSWSVPVVKEIFSTLVQYFAVKRNA